MNKDRSSLLLPIIVLIWESYFRINFEPELFVSVGFAVKMLVGVDTDLVTLELSVMEALKRSNGKESCSALLDLPYSFLDCNEITRACSALPQHVRNAPSLSVFRRELKTVLFRSSFPDAI